MAKAAAECVVATEEFYRIADLAKRDWQQDIERDELRAKMTQYFRLPRSSAELRPIQAAALADLHDLRGLLGGILAGEGKTLISYLAPNLFPVQRPLLLVPAALRQKTLRDFKRLSKEWRTARYPVVGIENIGSHKNVFLIESYSKISQKNGQEILDKYKPDMVIADEAHKLKNLNAACTRRVLRHLRSDPNIIFVPMSGTVTVRSLHNYWHLAYYALRHGMPLPRIKKELEIWADALDEKKSKKEDWLDRPHPGAIFEFASDADKEVLRSLYSVGSANKHVFKQPEAVAIARRAFQTRLSATPGVIISRENSVAASLQIRRLSWNPGLAIQNYLDIARRTRISETGELLEDKIAMWRHARELGCGFIYRWEPDAPEDWLKCRKAWFKEVRRWLQFNKKGLDSVLQVEQAVRLEKIDDAKTQKVYADWQAIKSTFEINTVPVWVDDSCLKRTMAWMEENPNAIVWTEHRAFGTKLSELSGVGYCANGGLDQNGVLIDDYDGKTVIASALSNVEGRNLQAWSHNLVVSVTPNGGVWEQLLARTHRPGQLADTVYCDWVASCPEQDEGFQQALKDARYIEDTTGQRQRLNYADHV